MEGVLAVTSSMRQAFEEGEISGLKMGRNLSMWFRDDMSLRGLDIRMDSLFTAFDEEIKSREAELREEMEYARTHDGE